MLKIEKNKITKNTKAIFLVTLLILGTLSTISPSFMVGAQAVPQYGMEREYGSYEQPEYGIDNNNYQKSYGEDSYGPEYKDKEYNSYELDYGMDNDRKSYKTNSYEPTTTSYGNDNSYKESYGNDNSYDKSKDSKKSVSLNKLNCINNNVNINGNNNGTINVGNSGKSATGSGTDEGYLGVGSLGGNGEEEYDNGYNKQKDKGFTCIINNNNNNVLSDGGNATNGDGNVTDTCEECFLDALGPTNLIVFETHLANYPMTLKEFCQNVIPVFIETGDVVNVTAGVNIFLVAAGITLTPDELADLVACLFDVFDGGTDNITRGLIPFDINTNTAGGLTASNINTENQAPSFSPPTIAQATEDLSALEKTTKLKQQWLELLP